MAGELRPEPRPVSLADLCHAVPGCGLLNADRASESTTAVTGITHDSRRVRPGDLYLALPGRTTHGARFAADAVSAGAIAVLTDPEGLSECEGIAVPMLLADHPRRVAGPLASAVYGWPVRSLQILGVTGTNGKTTVAAMLEAGLRAGGLRTGAIGTLGLRIDDTQYAGARTTPEATDLQAAFAVMRDRHVQAVAMEASSIAVVEHRLDGFLFDVIGFTNLSQDHLDYHRDMESYFAAKAALFRPDHAAIGVVGLDDEYGRRLVQESTIPTYTWSLTDPTADWHADSIRAMPTGSAVSVVGPGEERTLLHVPMPGEFNAGNALCAYSMLRVAGVGADSAVRGIGGVLVPGRMQVVRPHRKSADVVSVIGIVDYAHTPDAIARVVEAVQRQCTGRLIVVLGAGGDRDQGKRPLMGRSAARLADVVIVTDDNPRREDPADIRASVLRGAREVEREGECLVIEHPDRAQAIFAAVRMAAPHDVVLVLGKGHEQGQEVDGVVTAFDDAAVLSSALEKQP